LTHPTQKRERACGSSRLEHGRRFIVLAVLAAACSSSATIGGADGGGTGGLTSDGGAPGTGGVAGTGGAGDTGGAGGTGGMPSSCDPSGGPQTGGVGTGGSGTGGFGTGGVPGTGGAPARLCDTECPSINGLLQPATTEAFRALLTRRWRWCTVSQPLFGVDQGYLEIANDDSFVVTGPASYVAPSSEVLRGTLTYGAVGALQVTLTTSGGEKVTTNAVLGTGGPGVVLILNSGPHQSVYYGS